MMNAQTVQYYKLFHLLRADWRSDLYSLSGGEMSATLIPNLGVFDSDTMNNGQIAQLQAGGERAANTA